MVFAQLHLKVRFQSVARFGRSFDRGKGGPLEQAA